MAHHTTAARGDLAKKWRTNLATVKARKGALPTMPPSDLVKTAALFNEEKKWAPLLRGTLALTTNQEPRKAGPRGARVRRGPWA